MAQLDISEEHLIRKSPILFKSIKSNQLPLGHYVLQSHDPISGPNNRIRDGTEVGQTGVSPEWSMWGPGMGFPKFPSNSIPHSKSCTHRGVTRGLDLGPLCIRFLNSEYEPSSAASRVDAGLAGSSESQHLPVTRTYIII